MKLDFFFTKVGFSDKSIQEEYETIDAIEKCWSQLQVEGIVNEKITLDEFLGVDKNVTLAQYPTNDEILHWIIKNKVGNSIGDEEEDIDKPQEFFCPNTNKVMAAFNIIRREFQHTENVPDDMFNSLNK